MTTRKPGQRRKKVVHLYYTWSFGGMPQPAHSVCDKSLKGYADEYNTVKCRTTCKLCLAVVKNDKRTAKEGWWPHD